MNCQFLLETYTCAGDIAILVQELDPRTRGDGLLTLFTPDECQNYVRHCGYRIADVRL